MQDVPSNDVLSVETDTYILIIPSFIPLTRVFFFKTCLGLKSFAVLITDPVLFLRLSRMLHFKQIFHLGPVSSSESCLL